MATQELYDAQCCACRGYCMHTGPHSYCQAHGPQAMPNSLPPWPPFRMNPGIQAGPQSGWQCPRCNRVYGPAVQSCPCNNLIDLAGVQK